MYSIMGLTAGQRPCQSEAGVYSLPDLPLLVAAAGCLRRIPGPIAKGRACFLHAASTCSGRTSSQGRCCCRQGNVPAGCYCSEPPTAQADSGGAVPSLFHSACYWHSSWHICLHYFFVLRKSLKTGIRIYQIHAVNLIFPSVPWFHYLLFHLNQPMKRNFKFIRSLWTVGPLLTDIHNDIGVTRKLAEMTYICDTKYLSNSHKTHMHALK